MEALKEGQGQGDDVGKGVGGQGTIAEGDTDKMSSMGPPKPKRNWVSSNKYLVNSNSLTLPEDKKRKAKGLGTKVNVKANDKVADSSSAATTKKSDFTCHLCEGSFSSQCSLQKHLKRHTGERPFECTSCKKRFFSKFSLTRHIVATHDPSLAKPILCNICDKRFSSKEWLVIHVRSHSGETPFSCGRCDKKFTCQNGLNRHSLTHKTEKSFLCYECGKMFQTPQSMRIHLESHITDRKFNCDKCRMRFKRALDLQRHGRVHIEVPMLSCPLPQCEHQFRRKDNLLRHLQLTHDQSREEAHETFNMLDTSCKSSSFNESGTNSIAGTISNTPSEIGQTPNCSAAEDSETTQDSISQPYVGPIARKTKVKVKAKNVTKKTDQASNTRPPPKKPISKPRKRKGLRVETADLENSKVLQSQEMNATPSNLSQTITRSPEISSTDPITSPKKSNRTSVTTSVIRLVKSSSSTSAAVNPTQNQPVVRKRQKRSWELGNNPEPEVGEPPKSPPPFQTLLSTPAPYPSRNPSPGQEYINYLNSLNNPVAFRVRDRSSSFGTSRQNRNHHFDPQPQPSHTYSYEQDGPSSYRSETAQGNFTNPSHLPQPAPNYDYNSTIDSIHPSYFLHQQEPNFHPELQESGSCSMGYLDLSSSDPDKRRISFEPYSSPGSRYQTETEEPSSTTLVPYYLENDSNYQQREMPREPGFEPNTRIPQPREFSDEVYNYNSVSVSTSTFESGIHQNPIGERPCNVPVIKRASASASISQNQHRESWEPSGMSQHHQEYIRDFMQGTASPGRRHSIETGSPGPGLGLITTITLSESEEETFPRMEKSSQMQIHQTEHHPHPPSGGKDMIVNRDPRKNFLHRENFSRNRNQD